MILGGFKRLLENATVQSLHTKLVERHRARVRSDLHRKKGKPKRGPGTENSYPGNWIDGLIIIIVTVGMIGFVFWDMTGVLSN